MSTTKKPHALVTTKDAVTAAATAGAGAVSGLAVGAGATATAIVLAALLVAFFPPALAAVTEVGVRRMKARGDRLFETIVDAWARDEEKTPEEVAGLLEAAKDDPNVADAIWRVVRGLMEAPTDVAAVPLGLLAAEYARDKRAADAFFRGTVRLLSDASEREIDELARILSWVAASTRRREVVLTATDMEERDRTWHSIPWRLYVRPDDPDQPELPHQGRDGADINYDPSPEDGERLLFLLKSAGLAYEQTSGGLGGGVPQAVLRRAVVERLAALLRAARAGS